MYSGQLVAEIKDDLQRIRTRKPPAGAEGPALSEEFLKLFGAKLFRALFVEKLDRVYRDRLRIARDHDCILRLNLCLPTSKLAEVPWEYLFDPEEERFLASSEKIAFSRRVPTTQYAEPLTVTQPLRLLVVISNPSDLGKFGFHALDGDKEKKAIEDALAGCYHIEKRFLDKASHTNLQDVLGRFKPNILHFIGHGKWRDDRPNLVITNDADHVKYLNEEMLCELLRGQKELKVVLLAACQSGQVREGDGDGLALDRVDEDVSPVGEDDWDSPARDEMDEDVSPVGGDDRGDWAWGEVEVGRSLVGMAPELLKMGIPAVLAMQHGVREDTARRFAFHFYKALADEEPIDAAVNLARRDLLLHAENRRDFGTPVLYTLIPRLFKLDLSLVLRLLEGGQTLWRALWEPINRLKPSG